MKQLQFTRNRFFALTTGYIISNFEIDETTEVEPGKATEIADLFKSLDESGEVHSYEYSGDTPTQIYGQDFAENPTTYQGAYEEWEFGDAVREAQQAQHVNAVSDASEVSETSSDAKQTS